MSYSHFTDGELIRHLYAQGGLNALETELLLRFERAIEVQEDTEEVLERYERGEMVEAA